jgi:hypothetical protein
VVFLLQYTRTYNYLFINSHESEFLNLPFSIIQKLYISRSVISRMYCTENYVLSSYTNARHFENKTTNKKNPRNSQNSRNWERHWNKIYIHKENSSRLILVILTTALLIMLSFHFLSENVNIKIYKIITIVNVLCRWKGRVWAGLKCRKGKSIHILI